MPGTPRRRLEAPATCIPDCLDFRQYRRQSGQATLNSSIIHENGNLRKPRLLIEHPSYASISTYSIWRKYDVVH
jgi:hypothetical protein